MSEKNNNQKIQEINILEQGLQNLFLQKQAFQMELEETNSALNELENSGDDVFKIIGKLMIKSSKTKIKEELSNKEKIIELRMKNIEKQEDSMSKKLEEVRNKILEK